MIREESSVVAPLIAERARAAGLHVELAAIGGATVVRCDERPHDLGFNRAFTVDAREHEVVERIAVLARDGNRRVVLELATATLGDAQRTHLAGLGLARGWDLFELHRDLDASPVPSTESVRVRAV